MRTSQLTPDVSICFEGARSSLVETRSLLVRVDLPFSLPSSTSFALSSLTSYYHCSPSSVFPDADLASAVEGSFSRPGTTSTRRLTLTSAPRRSFLLGLIACKFRLSGQTCVCCNRIYLHKDIYEEFTALLVKKGSSRLSRSLPLLLPSSEPDFSFFSPSPYSSQSPPSPSVLLSPLRPPTVPSSTLDLSPKSTFTFRTLSPMEPNCSLEVTPSPNTDPTSTLLRSWETCLPRVDF